MSCAFCPMPLPKEAPFRWAKTVVAGSWLQVGPMNVQGEPLAPSRYFLERMGPTFVKLGQLLSTRADLLPQPYLDALARLQDDVAPIDTVRPDCEA